MNFVDCNDNYFNRCENHSKSTYLRKITFYRCIFISISLRNTEITRLNRKEVTVELYQQLESHAGHRV